TSRTWLAMRSICSGSVPYSRSPIRASPESFNRIRVKAAEAKAPLLLPHLEASEADVLARLGRDLRAQVLDRLALVLVLVEVLLVQKDDLRCPLLDLAVDDLGDDVVGLAVLLRRLLQDPALVGDVLFRNVIERDVTRVHRGDVDGDVVSEFLEVVVECDEVRLALH